MMSLGYHKGKYWVPDTTYAAYTEWEPYRKLLEATRLAGFSVNVEFSYYSQNYMAETRTIYRRTDGSYSEVPHANAYDPNPMLALTKAVRKDHRVNLYCTVLCLEIDIRVLAQKLLRRERAERELEKAVVDLTKAMRRALR